MIINGMFFLYLILFVSSENNKDIILYNKRNRKIYLDKNEFISKQITNELFNVINNVKKNVENIYEQPKNKYNYQHKYNYSKKYNSYNSHNSHNNKYLRGSKY